MKDFNAHLDSLERSLCPRRFGRHAWGNHHSPKSSELGRFGQYGEAIAQWCMDGAMLPTLIIAANKAFTAARLARPSRAIGDLLKTVGEIAFFGDARYVGFAGGNLIIHNGKTLGARGVSGLTRNEDEALDQIGVAAIMPSPAASN